MKCTGSMASGAWTFILLAPLHINLAFAAEAASSRGDPTSDQAITLPSGQYLASNGRQVLALSPDGTQLAYLAGNRIHVQPLRKTVSAALPREIMGSAVAEGIFNLAFSSDGQSLAYWSQADQTVKRISVAGGTAATIAKAVNPAGLSWSGERVLLGGGEQGILEVPAAGGTPVNLIALKEGEYAYGPERLPGSEAVLFTLVEPRAMGRAGWDKARIVVQVPGTSERRVVVQAGSDAHYVARLPEGASDAGTPETAVDDGAGWVLYALDGEIQVVPFDAQRLEVTGPARVIATTARVGGLNGPGRYSITRDGVLAYVPGKRGLLELAWVDRSGRREVVDLVPETTFAPRLSPDRRLVALDIEGYIWVRGLTSAASMRQVSSAGSDQFPIWSADGGSVLYTSARGDGIQAIYRQPLAPSEQAEGRSGIPAEIPAELFIKPGRSPEHWSEPTQQLTYITLKENAQGGRDYDIWSYSLSDKSTAPLVAAAESAELASMLSPDGRWIAYQSNASGRYEIYIEPYPLRGIKSQISREGGMRPVWSPDGTELTYDNEGKLYVVGVQREGYEVKVSQEPKVLPTGPFVQAPLQARRQYDFSADGQRVLMLFRIASEIALIR